VYGALRRHFAYRGRYSQIRLARSRVRKFSYTALCIATKREYGLNDEFQMTNNPTETFTLGHSPDPDDAFMFYAIAKDKIDLRGYRFQHRLEDIQTLNERAQRGELHISAVSIHAYVYVADKYALLPCGASMGDDPKTPNAQRPTLNTQSKS
jgi:Menaquinone biosynthesis